MRRVDEQVAHVEYQIAETTENTERKRRGEREKEKQRETERKRDSLTR